MATYEEKMKALEANRMAWIEKVNRQNEAFKKEEARIRAEERERRRKEEENFRNRLKEEIARDYNMSFEQAEILVYQAWEHGHSCGYNEVRSYAQDFAEWVEKILDIQRNMDY